MDRQSVNALFDLTGRVAIVTGGTRGIGRAIAEGFCAAGAGVVVASRKADACASVAAELRAAGADAIGVATHLGDLDAGRRLVAATVEHFGRLDILVNNAATALTQPVGEFTPDAWEKVYDVNLRGPVFLAQEALPYLDASPAASIVNVISAGAFLFSANTAMYSGAKAALMAITRSMAPGLAARGIRVERARAGHGRHRHGPQQHAGGGGPHGRSQPDAEDGIAGGDDRPGAVPRVRRVELHDRAGADRRRGPRPPLINRSAPIHGR